MGTSARFVIGLISVVLLTVGGFALLSSGVYGWTIFVLFPVVLGGFSVWVFRPKTALSAAGLGALPVLLATSSLLLLGKEGLGCVAMALPLALPLGALGGWLTYLAGPSKRASRGGAAMLLLLAPASFVWDTHAHPAVFEVRTAISIDAPPERVWKNVVTFSELPEPQEWYFQTGLAYPRRARIEGSGVGAVRYCEFSTGPFVEPVEVWDEPRLLRFSVTANPAPLHEWSPFVQVVPKHLHGYFVSEHGQFLLTRLSENRTRLEGTTWYRHGLWPAEYWRWWSDAIIHRIHLRVLNHIKTLSERE